MQANILRVKHEIKARQLGPGLRASDRQSGWSDGQAREDEEPQEDAKASPYSYDTKTGSIESNLDGIEADFPISKHNYNGVLSQRS